MIPLLKSVLLCSLIFTTALSAQESSQRPLIEFWGEYNDHSYRLDKGSQFQFGAPVIGLAAYGFAGLGSSKSLFGGLGIGAMNEDVETGRLPNSVVTAAAAQQIPLGRTSLRLQSNWAARFGFYPIRHLQTGFHFARYSWRYDSLANGAGTTIPYVKGVESSNGFFVRYGNDFHRVRIGLGGEVAHASVRFTNGIEAYLSDNDGPPLTHISGISLPVSLEIGYPVVGNEDGRFVPFVRFEEAFTRAAGTKVDDRRLLFGVELSGRR
jgi:hypothetical protein